MFISSGYIYIDWLFAYCIFTYMTMTHESLHFLRTCLRPLVWTPGVLTTVYTRVDGGVSGSRYLPTNNHKDPQTVIAMSAVERSVCG